MHVKKRFRLLAWRVVCAILILLGWQPVASAESARSLVESGNAAYDAGRYDQAVAAYEKAAALAPWSAVALLNEGNARYRQADFNGAMASFTQAAEAAASAGDRTLAARSHFNLGNSAFQAGDLHRQDPKQALPLYEESVDHYRAALELDPQLLDAAYNLEVSRRAIAAVMAEQKKKQAQSPDGDSERQNLAESLQQLLQQQQQAAGQSSELAEQQAEEAGSPDVSGQAGELAAQQERLSRATQDLADKLGEEEAEAGDAHVKKNLEKAVQQQQQAAEMLRENEPSQAMSHQEEAAEEMRQALAAMTADQKTDQKKGQQAAGQDGDSQPAAAASENGAGRQPDDSGAENAGNDGGGVQELPEAATQTVRDILAEEQQNSRARRLQKSSGYSGVEKDW